VRHGVEVYPGQRARTTEAFRDSTVEENLRWRGPF
jgi:hypothetical protein